MYVTSKIQVTWWTYDILAWPWIYYFNNKYKWWLSIGPLQISKQYRD